MKRAGSYNTKQREAVLRHMISSGGAHLTAAQISERLNAGGEPVGRTTVYRCLDRLAEEGRVRRFVTDGVSAACYQYVEAREDCHGHLHLKCEACGNLQHLECGALDEIYRHFYEEHAFELNVLKTVLYGKCGRCAKKENLNIGGDRI
ncbi:MAG: transcriptional repressor [Oscillospiraceae bacterium]|jgi:Fur family ferric uptake transcriptional regulator|nr:transcriptional repressor [Oscillospiraceae bacterium]